MKNRLLCAIGTGCLVAALGMGEPAKGDPQPYDSQATASAYPESATGNYEAFADGEYDVPSIPIHVRSGASANVRGPGSAGLIKGFVSATASQTNDNSQAGVNVPAQASAYLSYFLEVPTIREDGLLAQFLANRQPVTINIQARIDGFSDHAVAFGELRGYLWNKQTGERQLEFDEHWLISPDGVDHPFALDADIPVVPSTDTFQIVMNASVDAKTNVLGLPSASIGNCTIDPSFAFDQTAFDAEAAQLGFQTFPLDQYFDFAFSPGLDQLGVPEPPSAALLLLGGAALFLYRLRQGHASQSC